VPGGTALRAPLSQHALHAKEKLDEYAPDKTANAGGQAMIVDVSTVLNCSASKAWDEVQKSALLRRVAWPLVRFVPSGAPFPDYWTEGLTVHCKPFVFGVIPFGVHTMHMEKVDQRNHEIHSREHDALIARWDHRISIQPLGDSQSTYRDFIYVDAGILTFVVWAWANCFYRYRQCRWRALAKAL
jgi:hypothetical protein